jgi:hypothetical protein
MSVSAKAALTLSTNRLRVMKTEIVGPGIAPMCQVVQDGRHRAQVSACVTDKQIYSSLKGIRFGLLNGHSQEGWVSGVIQRDVRVVQMNSRIIRLCVRVVISPTRRNAKKHRQQAAQMSLVSGS